MKFAADTETFVAERRAILERGDAELGPRVSRALVRYRRTPDAAWYSGIIEGMRSMWNEVYTEEQGEAPDDRAAEQREEFLDDVTETLDLTTEPAPTVRGRRDQEQRITRWLSTATVNSATTAVATFTDTDSPVLLEWVTMRDNDVRASHREVGGTTMPVGERFTLEGVEVPYPGAPVGPPELWLNCRCLLRPTLEGEEMSAPTTTFAATETEDEPVIDEETDEEIDPDAPVMEDGILDEVPFHGVLAPIGKTSGDRRRFKEGSITHRDGPAPVALRWVKADVGAHNGAVRVANFTNIWEEDGEVRAEGVMFDTPEAQEAIALLAQGAVGVSVDLDMMTANLVNEDGSEFDFDLFDPSVDPEPIMEVEEGRISAATLVDIPAFQEAYIALGTWAESSLEASCVPCEAAALVADMTEEQVAEFEAALEEGSAEDVDESALVPASVVASASERTVDPYFTAAVFDALMERFAPGTKDGPGWITNPKETQRLRNYWTKGAGAAKIRWGQPGDFNRCRRQLAKYITNPRYLAGTCANLHKVALGIWPGQHAATPPEGAIMASAFTLVTEGPETITAAASGLPAEWFANPGLTEPTPLTVTDEGYIYGHVASWGVCHIAQPAGADTCTLAPKSQSDYAYFKTGLVRTDEGDIPVGHITMNTGHAGQRLGAHAAASHYDNTGAVVADVNVGEDAHGIWFAGALRPGVEEEALDALRAAALSGDWRTIRNNYEMVAALAVNVPGFPIPRTTVTASAEGGALVASGVVWARHEDKAAGLDPNAIAEAVLNLMDKRQRLTAVRAVMSQETERERKARLEKARQKISL